MTDLVPRFQSLEEGTDIPSKTRLGKAMRVAWSNIVVFVASLAICSLLGGAVRATPALGIGILDEIDAPQNAQDPDLANAKKAFNDRKYELAIELSTKVIERDPKNSGALNTRACAFHTLGNF